MSNVLIGFANVLQPINLLICLGGLAVGVLFGALPGFSATMAVAVFVPFTYTMNPGTALLLLSVLRRCVRGFYSGSFSRYPGDSGLRAYSFGRKSSCKERRGRTCLKPGNAGKCIWRILFQPGTVSVCSFTC